MDFHVGQRVRPTNWLGEGGMRVPQWYRSLAGSEVYMIVREIRDNIILVEVFAQQLPMKKVAYNGEDVYVGWVTSRMIKNDPLIKRF